jgi:hypothetical protein
MTFVDEARSALQNGASAVLTSVEHNKTAYRILPAQTKKLVKRANRRLAAQRARRVPILPIVLAVGGTVAGVVAGLAVRRYLSTKEAGGEADVEVKYTRPETALAR